MYVISLALLYSDYILVGVLGIMYHGGYNKSLIYTQVSRGPLPDWADLGPLSTDLLITGSRTRRGRPRKT